VPLTINGPGSPSRAQDVSAEIAELASQRFFAIELAVILPAEHAVKTPANILGASPACGS